MNMKLHTSVLADMLIVLADAFVVALCCAFSSEIFAISSDINLIALYSLVTVFMMYIYEFYTTQNRKKYEVILSVIIVSLVTNFVVVIINLVIDNQFRLQYPLVLMMLVQMIAWLSVWKLILVMLITRIEGKPKLLVIESLHTDNALARKIKYSYMELYQAWYIQIDVDNEEQIKHVLEVEFNNYESIFISPSIPEQLRNRFVSNAVSMRKEIYIIPNLYNISITKTSTVSFDDTPTFRIKPLGLTKLQKILKRTIDLIASAIGIVVSSPIMLVVALAIKLDSEGPVIYAQERMTENRKAFKVYKFRTMVKDAETLTGPILATDDDPRITKLGKVLRSLRLDELPQLFNIFIGHMSVVGPRPERPVFVEKYCDEIENYDKRFFVKAGLTGQAQVYARYDTSASDKTLYDLLYIKDYSIWLDIKLILLTIKIMFIRESSEGVKKVDYTRGNNIAVK